MQLKSYFTEDELVLVGVRGMREPVEERLPLPVVTRYVLTNT